MSTPVQPILVAGDWRPAAVADLYTATNPATGESLPGTYPISEWSDIDLALTTAAAAAEEMLRMPPAPIAAFLQRYADLIDARAETIAAMAALETGLPLAPRLKDVELPRTTKQLRLSAEACLDGQWRMPVIDRETNIRSVLEPIGPVLVFGPNNFPLAYNGICGGDFASAIAAGNPVIAKGHPLHPTTTRLLAQAAVEALGDDLPPATVQLLYGMTNDDGLRMVADRRLGAVGFTGSRRAGTALKRSADEVGKPIFLEMSSINPVVILPGALDERFQQVVDDTTSSGLMAAGQFCTSPGLVVLVKGDASERFIAAVAAKYASSPCATLLGVGVRDGLWHSISQLRLAGAAVVTGGEAQTGPPCTFANTVLRTTGTTFLMDESFQTEAFGNAMLMVVADDTAQVARIVATLEGNLTGSIYTATDGRDDAAYDEIAPMLRPRVGRLLNDKMPTGVAVSPAMNHGGPFPATGHPHFTAVGVPAALRRFTRLACYDNVREGRLPNILRG